MAARRQPASKPTNISDEAVAAKTGRFWDEWFAELDRAGADAWNHKTIARHLGEGYGISFWWAQTVTVAYERARGLRDKHEQPDGYQIQVERTIQAPVEDAWAAMRDAQKRLAWLPESRGARVKSVRQDTRRYLRLDWPGGTRVLMGVQPKGEGKCSAGVQESRLASANDAAQAKRDWAERLGGRLRALLEGAG